MGLFLGLCLFVLNSPCFPFSCIQVGCHLLSRGGCKLVVAFVVVIYKALSDPWVEGCCLFVKYHCLHRAHMSGDMILWLYERTDEIPRGETGKQSGTARRRKQKY